MKSTNLTIKDLFKKGEKLTFLVGAGCSVDAPSCLPAGRKMMDAIIKYSCAESEIKKLLGLEQLRFEGLVEIIRSRLDPELKIIDYYGQSDKPNIQHFFLAEMVKKGHFVMTTNFDFLIEYALIQSGASKNEVIPVITKRDFEEFSDPNTLFQKGKKTVYKIHGSTKNIIMGEDTRDSLVATIQAFGSNKEGLNVFQVEPFKRSLFNNISNGRTLVIIGYSGSDDFDIVPSLMVLKDLKSVVWINYVKDDKGKERIFEIDDFILHEPQKLDKVNQILTDLYKMRNAKHIYKVDTNTTRLLVTLLDTEPNVSADNFSISPTTWLQNNISTPDEFEKYFIPSQIYNDFGIYDDAMKCAKAILTIAEKKDDKKWKSTALNNIGFILEDTGKVDEALKHYRAALDIDEQLGDLRGKATRLNNIGLLLYGKGELDEALKHYREALDIAEQLGDLRGKATRLNNIGLLLKGKGELDEALKHYRAALDIAEQLGDLRGKANRLNNIGAILDDTGKVDEALKHYRAALDIDEQLGDLQGKAARLNNIGSVLRVKGELDGALKHFKKALEINEQIGDLHGKAFSLGWIGNIYDDLKNKLEAIKCFEQAIAIFKQMRLDNMVKRAQERLNSLKD